MNAQISNITASQRTDSSKQVDICYDLQGDINFSTFTVGVEVSYDGGGSYTVISMVTGDIGINIEEGANKCLVWNFGEEAGELYTSTAKFRLTVDSSPMGLTDYDGNTYKAIIIGDQECMSKNLYAGVNGCYNTGVIKISEKFGFFENDNTPCLSKKQRQKIISKLKINIELLKEQGKLDFIGNRNQRSLLSWPLRASDNYDGYSYYGISGFVDHNTNYPEQLLDYNCGNRTYDTNDGYNHQGVDVFTWPFKWHMMVNDDVEIIAASDGIIIDKEEGNFDQNCDGWETDSTNWNAVYIMHSDSSIIFYGHMKQFSLTEKSIGDTVFAGEYLGVVGSSGISTGPHLHLEIWKNDSFEHLIDPYWGECNGLNDSTWWVDQRPYYDSGINRIMTHSQPPEFFWLDCAEPAIINEHDTFNTNTNIYFSAYFRDQLPGQFIIWRLIDPIGNLNTEWQSESQEYYSASWWLYDFWFGDNTMNGLWKLEIEYEGIIYDHEFSIYSIIGDVNQDGLVNVIDISMIIGYILEMIELNEQQFQLADFSENGTISIVDIVMIIDYILNQ